MVQIFIAGNSDPINLPESTLRSWTGTGYFAKALEHSHLGGGLPGARSLPDDDPEAFKVLLYYIKHNCLPVFYLDMSDAEANTVSSSMVAGRQV
jgi:hypothetical protein